MTQRGPEDIPMTTLNFSDIQGFVARGYTFPYARFILATIHDSKAGRTFIGRITDQITTGEKWVNGKPASTLNIAFTYPGLVRLGLPEPTLQSFPDEYVQGMKARDRILGDTGKDGPENWDAIWKVDGSVHMWLGVYGGSEAVIEEIIKPAIPKELLRRDTTFHVNPTGRFVIGGPQGDSGLTGRKIIVDTYGGSAPHGGGAFSGKDPTKVDRSAAYMARYIAKNVVAAGLADRVLIQLAYAIGVADPVSVHCETYGTGRVPEDRIVALVREHFPLTPRGIIDRLKTRGSLTPEQLVDGCLDLLGPVEVNPDTKTQLLSQANEWGQISWSNGGSHASDAHVGQMLQLIVATREYQFA